MTVLNVLLVDDDPESSAAPRRDPSGRGRGKTIRWDACGDFGEALSPIEERRFDVVVTDVYRGRTGTQGPRRQTHRA